MARSPAPARSLRARALRLLAKREYSRFELERKLSALAADATAIGEALDQLEREGSLSDSRVVEQVMASRRRRFGRKRIAQELRDKGISVSAIFAASQRLQQSEFDAARTVWLQKFGTVAVDAREKARQMRFLQGRGFELAVIRKVVSGVDEN